VQLREEEMQRRERERDGGEEEGETRGEREARDEGQVFLDMSSSTHTASRRFGMRKGVLGHQPFKESSIGE
jgi:hypothetical protein